MSTSARSSRPTPPWFPGYAIAALSVATALAVDLFFNRLWAIDPSVSLFLCAVMFAAWTGGAGPALFATALSILTFDYFFLHPVYSFAIQLKDVPRLVFFAVAALFVVWLSAAQRRAEASLRRVRDEQQGTVEELQKLNDALRQSQAELVKARHEAELIIDTVPVLILRHRADGVIDFVNQVGRIYSGIVATNWTRRTSAITHPDDIREIEDAWDVALATGEPFETEARLRRADGEYRWFATRRVPLRNDDGEVIAWYAATYDIEDRKRAEDALRRSEADLARARQDLQLTIDSIPVMVSTFESDGTRSFVNKTWQQYTGHAQQEATGEGLNTSAYYHPDDLGGFEDAWRVAQAKGEMLSVDVRTRRADGAYRWYTMRRAPQRDESGSIVKWYSVGVDVEDQKIAENALRVREAQLAAAERELQLTLDTIPALAWRSRADGLYLNKRWLDYAGFSLEHAQGSKWQAAIHPDDRARLLDTWRGIFASGNPGETEARMRRFDGAYRWFLVRAEPLRDELGAILGWYGTNIDIEDRKRAESALQRSQAYSAEAQRLSQTGSFAWEVATRDYFWSDQAYDILGFDRSVKPSISLAVQRTHPEDRFIIERELDRSAHGAPYHDFEVRLLMPDGQIKHVHFLAHRITYQSGNEEIVGAVMDITEARKSQESLQAAQAALAHASRVATLGEISASIAHEVNQPLAAIIANGQACLRFLGRETPDLDDVRGAVQWIVKDGNRAGEVIRRVRSLLKKADTEKMPLDLNDAIDEVVALLQHELTAQQVTPRLELAPVLPPVRGDRVQLQQVIINLVMNGAEAMRANADQPHGLVIRSYEDEAQHVVVAVQDRGVGISAESAERVFEAFFSTKPGGLGMGLAICRSIVEAHGGRLWSSANNGPGATFQFALPSHRENAAQ
jgi:PAS domain S-box-containing protein